MKSRAQVRILLAIVLVLVSSAAGVCVALPDFTDAARPGARVLMDAHNCYPYFGWWSDRIERALSAGAPLAVEQDLLWGTGPKTGAAPFPVADRAPFTGSEPSRRGHFL